MAELIWRGKYRADGQRHMPPSVDTTLTGVGHHGAVAADNHLIHGDAVAVLSALARTHAQAVNLIYLDPPFASGLDFYMGDRLAYCDRWPDEDSYLQWLYDVLILAYELLAEDGSLYMHLAHHIGHYIKVMLDEIFGRGCFQNEIIWHYRTGGASRRRFARKHDTLFFYTRSPERWVFHPQRQRSYMQHQYGYKRSNFQIDPANGQQYSLVYARDVWEIPAVGSTTRERLGYPTQKPEALLERIISASSDVGDVVLDCFCGSGTTGYAAARLGRRWIMSDVSDLALELTQQRVQALEPIVPFVIQHCEVISPS